jgi:hypothetical protein
LGLLEKSLCWGSLNLRRVLSWVGNHFSTTLYFLGCVWVHTSSPRCREPSLGSQQNKPNQIGFVWAGGTGRPGPWHETELHHSGNEILLLTLITKKEKQKKWNVWSVLIQGSHMTQSHHLGLWRQST